MPLIAETPRLRIQTWEPQDVEALCVLTREEGLSEFSVSGYANFSKEHAERWIAKEGERFKKSKLGKFAVFSKQMAKPIGVCGIFENSIDAATVEMNYRLPTRLRGQGFAYEAAMAVLEYGFKELNLETIYANVDLRNLPSQGLLKKLGMSQIGLAEYHGIQASRWSISIQDFINRR